MSASRTGVRLAPKRSTSARSEIWSRGFTAPDRMSVTISSKI
ncbi:MAG: hypothetical protein WDO24_04950 [Pseudomonadota bacterium]